MNKLFITILALIGYCGHSAAQWQTANTLLNLNDWSSQPGFIAWHNHPNNAPGQHYGSGIQMVLGSDHRFGAQIVIPTFEQNIYFRRNLNSTWDDWTKVWSSNNLNTISENFSAKNLTANGELTLFNVDNSTAVWDNIKIRADGTNSYIESNGDENGMVLKSNGGNKILLMSDVGIGTATPQEKLSVNGKIRAKEIKVEATNWPDYVFKPGYEKMGLAELEKFISKHGHLPEVPAAAEVDREGIALGEMNKILLKKVEELTLHLIEKDRQLANQDQKIKNIEILLKKLIEK